MDTKLFSFIGGARFLLCLTLALGLRAFAETEKVAPNISFIREAGQSVGFAIAAKPGVEIRLWRICRQAVDPFEFRVLEFDKTEQFAAEITVGNRRFPADYIVLVADDKKPTNFNFLIGIGPEGTRFVQAQWGKGHMLVGTPQNLYLKGLFYFSAGDEMALANLNIVYPLETLLCASPQPAPPVAKAAAVREPVAKPKSPAAPPAPSTTFDDL